MRRALEPIRGLLLASACFTPLPAAAAVTGASLLDAIRALPQDERLTSQQSVTFELAALPLVGPDAGHPAPEQSVTFELADLPLVKLDAGQPAPEQSVTVELTAMPVDEPGTDQPAPEQSVTFDFAAIARNESDPGQPAPEQSVIFELAALRLDGVDAGQPASEQSANLAALPQDEAGAEQSATFELAALEPVPEDVLTDQRGGFMFEGMNVNFGAEIRTFLNGELVLQTNLQVDDTVTLSQVAAPGLTAVDAASLPNGVLDTGSIRLVAGDNQVFLANDGQTAVMHRIDGALQNVLINTMSGVNARQEVDATLGLAGGDAFRTATVSESALSQIHSMMDLSAAGGFGH